MDSPPEIWIALHINGDQSNIFQKYPIFMSSMIKSDNLKIEILKQYKKRDISYTASLLSDKIGTKFETIKKGLEFFYKIGVVEKEIKEHGKKTITYYNLTEIGKNLIKSEKI